MKLWVNEKSWLEAAAEIRGGVLNRDGHWKTNASISINRVCAYIVIIKVLCRYSTDRATFFFCRRPLQSTDACVGATAQPTELHDLLVPQLGADLPRRHRQDRQNFQPSQRREFSFKYLQCTYIVYLTLYISAVLQCCNAAVYPLRIYAYLILLTTITIDRSRKLHVSHPSYRSN